MSDSDKPKVEELAKELKARERISNICLGMVGILILAFMGGTIVFGAVEIAHVFASLPDDLKVNILVSVGFFCWVTITVGYFYWNDERMIKIKQQIGHKDKSDE